MGSLATEVQIHIFFDEYQGQVQNVNYQNFTHRRL